MIYFRQTLSNIIDRCLPVFVDQPVIVSHQREKDRNIVVHRTPCMLDCILPRESPRDEYINPSSNSRYMLDNVSLVPQILEVEVFGKS